MQRTFAQIAWRSDLALAELHQTDWCLPTGTSDERSSRCFKTVMNVQVMEKVLAGLSAKLQKRYDKGFSVTNLLYFRLFYQTYAERLPEIRHKACDELFHTDINRPLFMQR